MFDREAERTRPAERRTKQHLASRLSAESYLLIAIILLALAYRLGLGSWPVDDAYVTWVQL